MSNIVSIILILASIGTFFGYINPTYTHIKDLTVERDQRTQILANLKTLLLDQNNLLDKEKTFSQTDLDNLKTLLPDSVDSVRLIIELDHIAQQYGMQIRNFVTTAPDSSTQPQLGVDTSPYGTYTLTFTTTASYQGFVAFLKGLEQNLRLIDVTGVSFTAPSSSSAYDFTVSIKTYWLK